jgi:hypothetical protein
MAGGRQRPRVDRCGNHRLHEQNDNGDDEEARKTARVNGHFPGPVSGIHCETAFPRSGDPHVLLRLQKPGQGFQVYESIRNSLIVGEFLEIAQSKIINLGNQVDSM